MLYINRLALVCFSLFLMFGCKKEYSVETGGLPGNSGGGTPLANYGWSFTGEPAADYHGCIDDARYETLGGKQALFIEGTDSANNSFIIVFMPASGTFAPGTFNLSQGAGLTITDKNGNTYTPVPPSPFSLQITKVNDTLVEGGFSGTLTDALTNTTFKVSSGKFKALIGKTNPCGATGGGTDASFVLSTAQAACSNIIINGTYLSGVALTASNMIEVEVNVTVPGNWRLSTSTVNGIGFSGSGNFSSTGIQTIQLVGSGTPTKIGLNSIPIAAGSSSCSFIVDVKTTVIAVPGPGDYFPVTTNSRWVYHFTSPVADDSTEITSTGATQSIGGQTYNVLDNDILGFVYRKSNGTYYRYGPVDYAGFVDDTKLAEVIFLKDNVAAGTSWESAEQTTNVTGSTTKFKRKFTITEKNVSATILGVVYSNVITVKEEFQVGVGNFPAQTVTTSFMKYAKGIGFISFSDATLQTTADLKRFTVF